MSSGIGFVVDYDCCFWPHSDCPKNSVASSATSHLEAKLCKEVPDDAAVLLLLSTEKLLLSSF